MTMTYVQSKRQLHMGAHTACMRRAQCFSTSEFPQHRNLRTRSHVGMLDDIQPPLPGQLYIMDTLSGSVL